MVTSFKFNNCFAFNNPVEINFKADMRTKRFYTNIINVNSNLNVLKSAVIYGPNNTGKTALVKCVRAIKNTLLNKKINLMSNIFVDSDICEEQISFVYQGNEYSFTYKYDTKNHLYVYEKLEEIITDIYNNQKINILYLKDTLKDVYKCEEDKELEKILNLTSNNNILIYTIQVEKFKILEKIKTLLVNAANNIEIIDLNEIPNSKTIEILKNKNKETEKIVNFIKKADIYLDDYKYKEKILSNFNENNISKNLINDSKNMDEIKLVSVYKGKEVHSIEFDSLGTRKIVALASYIITGIEEGKTLIIDELDSSLHFKITRAIINMFNNEINNKAQIIATLHDISLLDCKKMFRKEQIWFTDKDYSGVDLYSLKEFSYAENSIRETTDIIEKYKKGEFGAIPDPDLISVLLDNKSNTK